MVMSIRFYFNSVFFFKLLLQKCMGNPSGDEECFKGGAKVARLGLGDGRDEDHSDRKMSSRPHWHGIVGRFNLKTGRHLKRDTCEYGAACCCVTCWEGLWAASVGVLSPVPRALAWCWHVLSIFTCQASLLLSLSPQKCVPTAGQSPLASTSVFAFPGPGSF